MKKKYIQPQIVVSYAEIESLVMAGSEEGIISTDDTMAKPFLDNEFDNTFDLSSEDPSKSGRAEWTEGIEIFPKVL